MDKCAPRAAAAAVAPAPRLGAQVPSPCPPCARSYDLVRDLGSGNFGVARLMRSKATGELVAIKLIERGDRVGDWGKPVADPSLQRSGGATVVLPSCSSYLRGPGVPARLRLPAVPARSLAASQVDRNVEREILNHRRLNHPNIVAFREVGPRLGEPGPLTPG